MHIRLKISAWSTVDDKYNNHRDTTCTQHSGTSLNLPLGGGTT